MPVGSEKNRHKQEKTDIFFKEIKILRNPTSTAYYVLFDDDEEEKTSYTDIPEYFHVLQSI